MAEIDSLELKITSDSTSAESGLDKLANTLDRLKKATSGGLGLTSVANQVGKLATETGKINGTTISNLKGLATALQTLSGVGNIKISSSIANQITAINTALGSLNVGSGASKIQELVTALQPLETIGKSNLGSVVSQLKKFPEVMQNLNNLNMGDVKSKLQELADAMKPLADEMQKVANGFSAFPNKLQKLLATTNSTTAANKSLSKSYVDLYANFRMAYTAIKGIVSAMAKVIKLSNDYIEDLNLFNASMGRYASEAQKYAEQVGEIMGIDPGEWMRNQGVFMTLATGFGVVSDRANKMSKNLTQLGYDLSSFFNLSTEDAMLKLQSGLAGELEPLRRIGFDLSQARLQQEAYTLGIDKKIAKMTQAEKAELRYHAILTQVTTAQGDMARTLNAPANQLRIFQAQVIQAGRAIGNIFIPALNAILPVAIAVVKVIRFVAESIASLFGFELPEVDYSGLDDLASGAGDVADALGDAGDNAKKLQQYTMGFDELNVINPDSGSNSDGGGDGGLGGGGFDFELPEYDFLDDLISNKVDGIVTSIQSTIEDVFFDWGSELNAENILEKIVVGLGAITGGYIGWKIGGVKGAIIGASIGMALGLILDTVVFDHDGKVSFDEFMNLLRDLVIVGGAGAIGFTIGGFGGAAIGLSVGTALTLLLTHIEAKQNAENLDISHIIENLLVGASTVGIGVAFGKKFGLEFLQGFDFMFSAGGGFGASLSSGISAVSSSMSTLGKTLTGAIGGITEFVAVFTGIKNLTSDIANGSTSLSGILTGLITVVAGLTAGFVAFSIAFNSTGIGLIVTLCVGAIAGLVGMVSGIDEAAEAAYQSTTDFQMMEDIISRSNETIERCNTSLDTMKNGITKLDTVSNDFAMASSLLNEIMDINENANASAYELAEMQTKVDILNGLNIDGLSLSIDETTGRVVQSRESVEKLIESLEKEAKMEAMRDLLVQTYKDQFTAQNDLVKATNDYNVASEALQRTRDALNNSEGLSFKQKRELRAAEEEQITALNTAVDAVNTAKTTYDELGNTVQTYTTNLTNMKLEEAGVGDGMCTGIDNALATVAEAANQMPELGKDVADGLKNGVTNNVKEEDYISVWSKIGNWFKDLFGIHSPSTVFYGYGDDVNNGFFNAIKDKFGDGKGTVIEWAKSVKDWFTDGDGNIFSKFTNFAKDIVTNFKDTIGNKYTETRDKMTTWTQSVKDWFTDGDGENIFTKFTSYASDIVSNFGTEVATKYTTTRESMTNWSKKVKSWFTTEDSGGTIFDKFTSYGSTLVTNLSGAIDGGVVQTDYETIFGRIETALSNVKDNIKGVVNSIIGFVESMTNGIVRAINGMINGLNKLSIEVPEGVPGIGGTSFGFNIPTLNTISIPRLSTGGMVDNGQMFVAREAGPELVGNIGRKTAVVNNEQIVASVSRGVAEANDEQNSLLREQNSLLRALLEKESGVYLDGKRLTNSVEKYQRQRGKQIVVGGAY